MRASVQPTVDIARACSIIWDAVVIGAGPSGALAAQQIASAGAAVLLVDKASFPRYKVCGCCLNPSALRVLNRCELGHMAVLDEAPQLTELCLAVCGTSFTIGIPSGAAVPRDEFDGALVAEALTAGARLLPETHATVGESSAEVRKVNLAGPGGQGIAAAKVIVVADGLGGRSICDLENFAVTVEPHSRIGAGTIASEYPGFYQPEKIYMSCSGGSYVGLVRLSNNLLDIAAAFMPDCCREGGGPGAAAEHVMAAAGLPAIQGIRELPWRGTPPLTRRRRRIAGERLFVIGDSALYIEPITGEGMAWALRSAEAVSPLVIAGSRKWSGEMVEEWTALHTRIIGHHGQLAGLIGKLIGHERVLSAVGMALSRAPALADPILKYITAL